MITFSEAMDAATASNIAAGSFGELLKKESLVQKRRCSHRGAASSSRVGKQKILLDYLTRSQI